MLAAWRRRHRLSQSEAALWLGVSQPYLSLLESGARTLTPALRARLRQPRPAEPARFAAALSALGAPAFAHHPPARRKPEPGALLLDVLAQPDAESRVVEALPWLIQTYAARLDLPTLVRNAKLLNLQNRLGFLLAASGAAGPRLDAALAALDPARLLAESTLCWDSMPAATRNWIRARRSPLAAYWNLLTLLRPAHASSS